MEKSARSRVHLYMRVGRSKLNLYLRRVCHKPTPSVNAGKSVKLCNVPISKLPINTPVALKSNGIWYPKRCFHSFTGSDLELIRKERCNTSQKIEDDLKLAGMTIEMIEDEIQKAAMKVDTTVTESGPTGMYEYYFHDSLVTGTRSYKRMHIESGEEKILFSTNFNLEEIGPMSLSVDEKYVARVINYTDRGICQKVVVRNTLTDIELILDLSSCAIIEDDSKSLVNVHNIEFGPTIRDGEEEYHSIYFTTCDHLGRPANVFAVILFDKEDSGFSHSKPELLLRDDDGSHFVDIQRTKGCQYVAIHSSSKSSNEIHLIGVDLKMQLVRLRQKGVQYFVDCGKDDDILIMAHTTSEFEGDDQKLGLDKDLSVFEAKFKDLPLLDSFPNKINSSDKASEGFFIEDIDIFSEYLCLYERSLFDAKQRMRIRNRSDLSETIVPMTAITWNEDDHLSIITAAGNMNFHSSSIKFQIENPAQAPVTAEYNFKSKQLKIGKQSQEEDYISRRILIPGRDEVNIPLTIVHRQGEFNIAARPILLIGYGCYGENLNLNFDPTIAPLLDRGFVVVFCHCRGGRELGTLWHEEGRLHKKDNSIEDFILAADYISKNSLVHEISEISSKPFIASRAFSAGGIILGAAINKHPTLFDAAVFRNAFLDVRNTMLNDALFLTQHEYDEFLDPRINTNCSVIESYCPVHNITDHLYPSMLLISALDDQNVPPTNAMAYFRKIKNYSPESSVHLHIEENGGHLLHQHHLHVTALENAFILGQYYKWKNSK